MKTFYVILFLLTGFFVRAQSVQWAVKGGGTATDLGKNIAVDALGNSYVTGTFQGTVTFGPYSLTGPSTPTNSYLAKYDPNGIIQWLIQFSGGSNIASNAIVYSPVLNSIYVAGKFTGTMTIGPYALISTGGNDCFFARFDLNGNCIWAVKAGSVNGDEVDDIDCDAAGNLLATGWSYTGAVFGGFVLPAHPLVQTYTTSIRSTGTFQWLVVTCYTTGSASAASYPVIKTDPAGNCFVSGMFNNTCVFGSQTLTSLGNASNVSGFLQKISSTGVILWTSMITGLTPVETIGITTDATGNVIISGNFRGTVNFGGIPLTSTGSATQDMYVAKYDPSGNILWAQLYGSNNNDYNRGLDILPNGTLVFSGYYTSSTQIGSITLSSLGNNDGFVATLNPWGVPIWAQSFGGSASEVVMTATPFNNASLYCTGYFASSAAVYGGFSLTTAGGFDVSVFKINLPTPLPVELMTFSVEPVGLQTALCQWITASETNNDFFTLEKSADGTSYHFLAKVQGSNSTTMQHKYSFDDLHPYSGTSYYRLTQTDHNGVSKLLKTVALHMHENQATSVQCYLNEESNNIIIHAPNDITQINVYDLNGHQVAFSSFLTGSGMTTVPAGNFSSGIYVVRVTCGDIIFFQKILMP